MFLRFCRTIIISLLFTHTAIAANQIFKSNFGTGVSLSAPYGFYSKGAWQDLKGLDQETGYSWPFKALNANFSGVQTIAYDVISPSTFDSYAHSDIRTVSGPYGITMNELFQTIKIKEAGLGIAQAPLLIRRSHLAGDVTDLYISYWFKLQPDFADKLDPSISSGNWRSIFEFKTGGYNNDAGQGDYRIQTTILKKLDGSLYWMSKGDNAGNGPWPLVNYWIDYNLTTPVPINTWFKFEVYWHRSSGADGRYWTAINGKVLTDHWGPNMGDYNNPINRIFIDTTYGGGHPTVDSHITGLEIWDGFPCGTGTPCFGTSIPPKVNIPLLDQAWTILTPSTFLVPANTFVDPDGGALTYSATLSSGAALPSWITFAPATRTFSGTPPSMVGGYNIRIYARDPKGYQTFDDFYLKVNNPPKTIASLPSLLWTEKITSTYTIPTTTFSDADSDLLAYSATLSSGAALPTWMSFNPTTRTLTGTPPHLIASYIVRITVKDPNGLSSYVDMTVKINNSPVVTTLMYKQTWSVGVTSSYTIPTWIFTDIDGDTLTYSATLSSGAALPSWMTFNASTKTFSGTPPKEVATYTIRVKVVDPGKLSASTNVDIKVNNKPTIANPMLDQTWKEGTAKTYTIPSDAFTDVDGDALTYRAALTSGAAWPSWLSFNASTRTLSGTPPVGSPNISVRITAVDTGWLFVLDDVVLTTP